MNGFAQSNLSAKEATKHINEHVKVQDVVTRIRKGSDSTFLTFGKGRRKNKLIIILTNTANKQMEPLPSGYPVNFSFVFEGIVRDYKGRPSITVSDNYWDVVVVH